MTRRILAVSAAALAVAAVASAPALAAKGGSGSATISFASSAGFAATTAVKVGSDVSFAVTANVKPTDVYSLWVSNSCTQNGVVVYQQYAPVQSWLAGPFSLSWNGGAAQCTAFVALFPDVWTPLKGGSMIYSVLG